MDKSFTFEAIKKHAREAIQRRISERPDVLADMNLSDCRVRAVIEAMEDQPMPADFALDAHPELVERVLAASARLENEIERLDARNVGMLLQLLPEIVPEPYRGKAANVALDNASNTWIVTITPDVMHPADDLETVMRSAQPETSLNRIQTSVPGG